MASWHVHDETHYHSAKKMQSFGELFGRLARNELTRVEHAIKMVEELRAAQVNEDAAFRRYFLEGAHGNVVRAAERRTDAASYPAIDAVFAIKDEAVKEESHAVASDECLAALNAVANELRERIARYDNAA